MTAADKTRFTAACMKFMRWMARYT